MHNVIRAPAVAGLFYSDDPQELVADLDQRLVEARQRLADLELPAGCPKALILPHAGHRFSGTAAAMGMLLWRPYTADIKRVVMLGPAHRLAFRGMALSHASHFSSPLGNLPLDQTGQQQLLDLPRTGFLEAAHEQEHCLEVQLPILQHVLGQQTSLSILPVIVGDTPPDHVAALLARIGDEQGTVVLISSDLSHFHEYHTALRLDLATCEHIEHFEWQQLDHHHACGCTPIQGALQWATPQRYLIKRLAYYNSGDSGGDHSRVVGYGAWALWPRT